MEEQKLSRDSHDLFQQINLLRSITTFALLVKSVPKKAKHGQARQTKNSSTGQTISHYEQLKLVSLKLYKALQQS